MNTLAVCVAQHRNSMWRINTWKDKVILLASVNFVGKGQKKMLIKSIEISVMISMYCFMADLKYHFCILAWLIQMMQTRDGFKKTRQIWGIW